MAPEPVVFVSHEATRTGAPTVLLHLLRWWREHSAIPFEVVLLRGGPLEADFAELGPTRVLGDRADWPAPNLVELGLDRIGGEGASQRLVGERVRRRLRDLDGAEVVYLNSAASARILHHLRAPKAVIAHVHELENGLRMALRPEDRSVFPAKVDRFIAVAECVADHLETAWGIDPAAITRSYAFVDADAVAASPPPDPSALRRALGLPADLSIVGGAGYGDWRKGIDLFVQLAHAVRARGIEAGFVWVGDRVGGDQGQQLEFDIRRAGLDEVIHLVGPVDDPFDWYRTFDVLAITSREDPCPLVGLEASLLGTPLVCFTGGGMQELVERGSRGGGGEAGVVVPYLDVDAMASAVGRLAGDTGRRTAMAERAAGAVRRDHDVATGAPLILDVVERALRGAS